MATSIELVLAVIALTAGVAGVISNRSEGWWLIAGGGGFLLIAGVESFARRFTRPS
jgi:hypothetical protein